MFYLTTGYNPTFRLRRVAGRFAVALVEWTRSVIYGIRSIVSGMTMLGMDIYKLNSKIFYFNTGKGSCFYDYHLN